jgi:hypothetical protein
LGGVASLEPDIKENEVLTSLLIQGVFEPEVAFQKLETIDREKAFQEIQRFICFKIGIRKETMILSHYLEFPKLHWTGANCASELECLERASLILVLFGAFNLGTEERLKYLENYLSEKPNLLFLYGLESHETIKLSSNQNHGNRVCSTPQIPFVGRHAP